MQRNAKAVKPGCIQQYETWQAVESERIDENKQLSDVGTHHCPVALYSSASGNGREPECCVFVRACMKGCIFLRGMDARINRVLYYGT